jgi:hypothetical protein
MITCTVCGTPNEDLATICSSCRGYLQGKVDTLDLFRTVWGLAESPRATMRRVLLARRKNYSFLLASLFGIACAYAVFWIQKAGPRFDNVLTLALAGVVAGPPFGIALTAFLAWVERTAGGLLGRPLGYRDAFAVTAYATVPVALSLVFVFPVEVAVFGIFFFGMNPPPMVINPVVYGGLIAFDAAAVGISAYLLAAAAREGHGLARWKAALVALAVCAAAAGVLVAVPRIP